MFDILRTLFLSSIVVFIVYTQKNFACSQAILEDASNNNASAKYIINVNIPPEIVSQIVNYLTDPQDLKAFSEVSQIHRNYAENYVDKYLENCIHNRKSKYKQKALTQAVDIKKFLRALSVACPLDHWWMKLEMKLLTYPLDKIQSNEEAFNYINPTIKYLKAYAKAFYSKPDRNKHVPLSIYHRALSILSSFKENNELKYQYGRLLYHSRYLQSNALNKVNLRKSETNFKELALFSDTLGARAKYFLFKYLDFNEDKNSLKKALKQHFTFLNRDTKIIKLQFNMIQSFEGGTTTYDGSVNILKRPPQKIENNYLAQLKECKWKASHKIASMLNMVELFEVLQDPGYINFFNLFKNFLQKSREKRLQDLNEIDLHKLHNLLKKISIIEVLMLSEPFIDEYGITVLEALALNNDTFSSYLLGRTYSFKSEEFAEKSFKHYKEAAEQGFHPAYATVGTMYLRGDGTVQDYQEAFKWIKKSADCNVGIAQFLLAEMYRKGQGVEPNYRLALKSYQKAADQPFYSKFHYKGINMFFLNAANYYIAWMHERGLGTERNLDKARVYYNKIPSPIGWNLADQALNRYVIDDSVDPFLFFCMGYLVQYKWGKSIEDSFQAIGYYKQAVIRANHSLSQIAIARIYKESSTLDSDVAKIFFQDVANKNQGIGYYNLALMYRDGEGVEQDDKKAFELFTSAANMMDGDALYSLGWMYEQGRGIEKDLKKAEYYYKKGKKRYPADAFYSLGRMYEYGLGVPLNMNKAIKWYRKAADLYYPEAIIKLESIKK